MNGIEITQGKRMKSMYLAALMLVASASAHATFCPDKTPIEKHPNGNCNLPIPGTTPSVPTPSTSSANAGATSAAAASSNSAAKSSSTSQAAGGNASAAGGKSSSSSDANGGSSSQQLSGVGNDNSSSSFRALAISLPSPVFTPPMPLAACPQANVEQEAHAVGWNFYSQAHGSVNTDNCTAIIVHNKLLEQCQYASAQDVLDALTRKVLPDVTPRPVMWLNLTRQECDAMKVPPVAVSADSVSNPVYAGVADAPKEICERPKVVAVKARKKAPKVAQSETTCVIRGRT